MVFMSIMGCDVGIRENKVEKYLDKEVTKLGGITRKWVSPGRDGVPDRIVIDTITVSEMIKKLQALDPSAPFADIHLVEVKTDDGKLTPVQEREHGRLREAGARVHTVYGQPSVDMFLGPLK